MMLNSWAFIGLITLILLIAAGIWAIKSNKTRPWILGIMAVLMALVVLSRQTFRSVQVQDIVTINRINELQQSLDQAQRFAQRVGTDTPPIWMPGVMDDFEAQVYSSMPAAAAALGKQVAAELVTLFAKNPPAKPIMLQLTGRLNPRGLDQESIDAAAAALRPQDSTLNLRVEVIDENSRSASADRKAADFDITLELIESNASPRSELPKFIYSPGRDIPPSTLRVLTSGTLKIQIVDASGASQWTARFTRTPWIDNFADFLNRSPQKYWRLARSTNSCTTRDQARREAETRATAIITSVFYSMRDPLDKTIPIFPRDLNDLGFIVDSFSQSFTGAAGPIWREALLLDLSPENLQTFTADFDDQRQTLLRQFLTLLGMIAIVCVIYVFINFATKGYYKSSLIGLSALLIIVGVVLVFVLGLNPFHTPKVNSVSITSPTPYSISSEDLISPLPSSSSTPTPPVSPTPPTPPIPPEEPTPPRPQTP